MHRQIVAALGGCALVAAPVAAVAAEKSDAELMRQVPDVGSVAMPKLDFAATAQDQADFDKYYYFHRAGTPFEAALSDLRECDGMARGLDSGFGYAQPGYPYAGTMAGAAGGVIANLMIAAIFGSAEKRRIRRVNMRRCMHYKGYDRFGLQKGLWEEFNFEEGLSGLSEAKRQGYLAQQAKVASGPRPTGKEQGL